MLIPGSRLALFAMFQVLIAGGLAEAGVAAPWHRSAGWWPIAAALSNILSLAILRSFTRAEGLPLQIVFRWNGGGIKRDYGRFGMGSSAFKCRARHLRPWLLPWFAGQPFPDMQRWTAFGCARH